MQKPKIFLFHFFPSSNIYEFYLTGYGQQITRSFCDVGLDSKDCWVFSDYQRPMAHLAPAETLLAIRRPSPCQSLMQNTRLAIDKVGPSYSLVLKKKLESPPYLPINDCRPDEVPTRLVASSFAGGGGLCTIFSPVKVRCLHIPV